MDKLPISQLLFSNLLDYAGTFPPAEKSLKDALGEASGLREALSIPSFYRRMALFLSHLEGISGEELFRMAPSGTPWVFTLISPPMEAHLEDPQSYETAMSVHLSSLWDFLACGRGPIEVFFSGFETKVSPTIAKDWMRMSFLEELMTVIDTLYLEFDKTEHFDGETSKLVESFKSKYLRNQLGIKIRTGGKRVPVAEEITHFLQFGARHGIPIKATQGLHDALTSSKGWGFVNLLMTASLLYFHGNEKFGDHLQRECLSETDPSSFYFQPDQVGWRDHGLSLDELEASRRVHQFCFGSCSAVEPSHALTQLLS